MRYILRADLKARYVGASLTLGRAEDNSTSCLLCGLGHWLDCLLFSMAYGGGHPRSFQCSGQCGQCGQWSVWLVWSVWSMQSGSLTLTYRKVCRSMSVLLSRRSRFNLSYSFLYVQTFVLCVQTFAVVSQPTI